MPAKHWNISTLVRKYGKGTYRDFESLVDVDEVLDLCKDEDKTTGKINWVWETYTSEDPEEVQEAVRDILLNILQEEMEYCSKEDLGPVTVSMLCSVVYNMITCNRWTKSGLNQDNQLESRVSRWLNYNLRKQKKN